MKLCGYLLLTCAIPTFADPFAVRPAQLKLAKFFFANCTVLKFYIDEASNFTTLAGIPAAIQFGGIDLVTTDFAPIT